MDTSNFARALNSIAESSNNLLQRISRDRGLPSSDPALNSSNHFTNSQFHQFTDDMNQAVQLITENLAQIA